MKLGSKCTLKVCQLAPSSLSIDMPQQEPCKYLFLSHSVGKGSGAVEQIGHLPFCIG